MIRYTREALSHVPSRVDLIKARLDISTIPGMDAVRALATWDADLLEKFERTPEQLSESDTDRSGAMAEFSYLAAEHGWNDEQILAGLYDIDDRWGKFVNRYNRNSLLVDLVNRARTKVGYTQQQFDAKSMFERLQKGGKQEARAVYGWQDFLASDFHVDWVLDGLLSSTGIGLITGFPGVGKTQMCIGIGAHLATGATEYLYWQNSAGPQRVLFLSFEMSGPSLHHFLSTMDAGYDKKDLLNTNFLTAPLGTPMPLDTKEGQDWFSALLDEFEPDVLIIDSLQKIASRELTDESAVKNLMHFLAYARDKHKVAMLVVHHHRKKSNDSQRKDGVELSDVYGSTYITTDVDFVLSLRKQSDDVLKVETLKNRLSREMHPFDVTRDANLGFSYAGMQAATQLGNASGLDSE